MQAPKLTGRPLAITRSTWNAWWQTDAAETWDAADVTAAERLIVLVDDLNRAKTAAERLRLSHELRQGERRLRLSHTPKTERKFTKPERPPTDQRPKMTPQQELAALTEGLVQDPLNPGWWR